MASQESASAFDDLTAEAPKARPKPKTRRQANANKVPGRNVNLHSVSNGSLDEVPGFNDVIGKPSLSDHSLRLQSLETEMKSLKQQIADLTEKKDEVAKQASAKPERKSRQSESSRTSLKRNSTWEEAAENGVIEAHNCADEGEAFIGVILSESLLYEQCKHKDVHLGESAWDVCLLIGFRCLSWQDVVGTVVAVVLNILLSILFCCIVLQNMVSPSIDEDTITAAKHWRGVYGHDYVHADHQTKLSLVALVCGRDQGMVESSSQMELYSAIVDYLEGDGDGNLNGIFMCFLASFSWCLLIMREWQQHWTLLRTIIAIPDGPPELLMNEEGEFSMEYLDKLRKAMFFVMVSVPRLAVSCFLCFVGIKFLAYTDNIGDLLLNAMALGFVLDADELMFSVMVPFTAQMMIQKTKALKSPGRAFFRLTGGKVDFVAATHLLGCAGMLLGMWFFYLEPFVSDMYEVQTYLCGGTLDFVTTQNPSSKDVYVYTQMNSFEDAAFADTYQKDVTLAMALPDLHGSSYADATTEAVSIYAIDELTKGSVVFGSSQLRCIDHLNVTDVDTMYGFPNRYHGMLAALRQEMDNQSISTCADLPQLRACLKFENAFARAICPQTCGCDNVWKGNMFATTGHGCPGSCSYSYNTALAGVSQVIPEPYRNYTRACHDVPSTVLNTTQTWKVYVMSLKSLFHSLLSVEQAEGVEEYLLLNGCEAIDILKDASFDLCTPNQGGVGRTVRPFCPHMCKMVEPSACTVVDLRECSNGCYTIGKPDINHGDGTATYEDLKDGTTFTVQISVRGDAKSLNKPEKQRLLAAAR